MTDSCRSTCCCCARCAQLPQTLQALEQTTQVTHLGHDLETLALLGTQFDTALITTRNAGALMSGQGGYAPLQTAAMPFRASRRRVSIRVAPNTALNIARSSADQGARVPGALVAATPDGQLCHRIQYLSDYDIQVAQSLEPKDFPPAPAPVPANSAPETPAYSGNVVGLGAVRQARDCWQRADAGQHVNDLLVANGQQRAATLPYVGDARAWQIVPQVIESFLSYLTDRQRPFLRVVPSGGIAQIDGGSLDRLNRLDSVLVANSGASSFSLDLSVLASVWVIASGRHWQLELYDEDQRCLAAILPDPWAQENQWADLLASLPRRR